MCVTVPHVASPPADAHLGVFHFLVLTSAAVNIHHKFLRKHPFSVASGIHRGAELLSHVVTLCLTSAALPDCRPQWLHRVTARGVGLQCLHTLTTPGIICLFDDSPPS